LPVGSIWIGLPFFVSAALMGVATLITLRFFRSHPAPAVAPSA
jgi:hypothetical protein